MDHVAVGRLGRVKANVDQFAAWLSSQTSVIPKLSIFFALRCLLHKPTLLSNTPERLCIIRAAPPKKMVPRHRDSGRQRNVPVVAG
jgi:hypothetical protein